MLILREVIFNRRADGEAFPFGDGRKMFRDRLEHLFVDGGFISQCAGVFGDVE